MPTVELIYFTHCPNVERARMAIRSAGVDVFSELDQETLSGEHPYKNFSSPTILVDGVVAIGSQDASAACSLVNWSTAADCIARLVSESAT